METNKSLILLVLALMVSGVLSATFTFKNNCRDTVWPATLPNEGSAPLSSTGFELASGASQPIDVPAPWAGRFWARTGCSSASGRFTCATADCASGQVGCNGAGGIPPATLAEANVASGGGQDFYDVSLVDGFNLPISVTPQGGASDCKSSSCAANVNSICPAELSVKGGDGSTIACKSACVAFGESKYCCNGANGTPQTCPPTNYSMIFANACPQAYSYAYDDKRGTFTCTGGPNYLVTFCP